MISALKGCDILYQNAALYSLWMPDSKVFYDINVEGTKTALNAALEQGTEKVVYTSTIAAIGMHGADSPANEEAEFNLWNAGDHLKEYFQLIGDVSGIEPPKLKLPYLIAIAAGYMYQLIANINKKAPVITAPAVRVGSKYAYYDVSKAVNELGFPQTPIKESIAKAIEWFRENGYVNNT